MPSFPSNPGSHPCQLDGKNNNEIAETLDISINTVKTLKKNAYKFLRESLGSRNLYILLFLLKNKKTSHL
ncbi:MAG: LuxR C-terminal-related transcriptional regulator [Butyricimonas faecihominis]